ncbi:MAG: hypothetical protein RLZZ546_2443 [Bacteroidota bacterium]
MYADELFMDGLVYKIWNFPVQWISRNILGNGEALSTEVTGSGDTTFHWILFFLHIVISLVSALFICFLDKRRKSYIELFEYIKVYVRYYLAYFLLFYGIIKIFCLQMPSPYLTTLNQPLGDFTPMGLLWSFIGASKSYSILIGATETLAGCLLMFRKSYVLGAFLTFLVMLNVFVLNMCYDVPVKLFSFFLIIVSLYLLHPYFTNLYHLIISKKQIIVREDKPLFKNKRWQAPLSIAKFLIIVWMFYTNISGILKIQKEFGSLAPTAPLHGKYRAITYNISENMYHPFWNDSKNIKELIIDKTGIGYAKVTMVNDNENFVSFHVDTTHKIIYMGIKGKTNPDTLTYSIPKPNQLLVGYNSKDLKILFDRQVEDYKLERRGFHWINEVPYNR